MSVASDGNRARGGSVSRSASSTAPRLAATAGGSGPRTARPRASSVERIGVPTRRRPGYASRWRARSLRPLQPRGCRLQRAPFPASPSRSGRQPAGRPPRRPGRCEDHLRGRTGERLEPGPVEELLDRGAAPQPTRAEQGAREPVRRRRSSERALHRLLRPAAERDRVHLVDVELRQRLVEGAHSWPSCLAAWPRRTRRRTARSRCGARTRASPVPPTRDPCRSPPTRSRAAPCSRSG